MDFSAKLQELRKHKGLTQEELAQQLFVSRTAVSKWESGRGYPNLESLKAISAFFGVSIDDLLSGEELLTLSEEDSRKRVHHARDLVFGILDIGTALLFVLPLFGKPSENLVQSVSLPLLTHISPTLRTGYYTVVIANILFGILTLALQNWEKPLCLRNKQKLSLALSTLTLLLFLISRQPYAGAFILFFLLAKVLILLK